MTHPSPTKTETAVFAAGLCTFINLYPTQALLPTLAKAFDTTLAHTGLTVTAALVAVALVAPFVGGISDAIGRRNLIIAAAFLLVIPTLLAAAAPTLGALIACRFAQGLLFPFIFAVTVAYIAEECPGPEAIRATGLYSIGSIIGGFFGRFVAGWTTDLLSWRAAFIILASLTLACAATIAATLPTERHFRPTQGVRGSLRGFGIRFPAGGSRLLLGARRRRTRKATATFDWAFAHPTKRAATT